MSEVHSNTRHVTGSALSERELDERTVNGFARVARLDHKKLEAVRDLGETLLLAKEFCARTGKVWLDWIAKRTAAHRNTVASYMRIAKHWDEIPDDITTVEAATRFLAGKRKGASPPSLGGDAQNFVHLGQIEEKSNGKKKTVKNDGRPKPVISASGLKRSRKLLDNTGTLVNRAPSLEMKTHLKESALVFAELLGQKIAQHTDEEE